VFFNLFFSGGTISNLTSARVFASCVKRQSSSTLLSAATTAPTQSKHTKLSWSVGQRTLFNFEALFHRVIPATFKLFFLHKKSEVVNLVCQNIGTKHKWVFSPLGCMFAVFPAHLVSQQSPESVPLSEGHPPERAPKCSQLHVPRRSQCSTSTYCRLLTFNHC